MVIKRLNRKELITQFEELRQGFASAKMTSKADNNQVALVSFTAYHKYADKIIMDLGGGSVLDPSDRL